MTEPTITCPSCQTEIRLTESLAAPLIIATRKQFEQQLARKDQEIAEREQGIREEQKQITEAKRTLDEQVAKPFGLEEPSHKAHLMSQSIG